MEIQGAYTALVLIAGILLFTSNRFRMDVIAMGMLLALYLSGVLTEVEALSGFAAPATITLGAMYVISGAMRRAGTTALISHWLLHLGGHSQRRLSTTLLAATATLSALMANLATMVIMLPVGLRLSRAANLRPGKILMPLGLFAILGGYLSLLGTSTNLIISDLLAQQTGRPLGIFEPALVAVPIVLLSLGWVVLFGQRFLPNTRERPKSVGPNLQDLEKTYALERAFYRLRIRSASDMAGQKLTSLKLRDRWDVNVVGVAPPGGHSYCPLPDQVLEVNDELIVKARKADILQMASIHNLESKGAVSLIELARLSPTELELAEVLVPPYSPLVGQTLAELNFSERYQLNVLALLRDGAASAGELLESPLQTGDRLLVEGPPEHVVRLRQGQELVVLTDLGVSAEDLISKRSTWMLVILAVVVLLSVTGLVALPIAALLGAFAAVLTKCTTTEGAYQDIDWMVLIFIAALLPLGTAISHSGLTQMIGTNLAAQLGLLGPQMVLALFVLAAVALTQVLSNSIVALMFAPIAFDLALAMDVNPVPFAIALLLAASAAFLTPITEVINILVRKPGGYEFRHYLALNTPVLLILLFFAIYVTPLIWPF